MKSFAEIISCENCKNKLLLEKEDIKWIAGKDAKAVLNSDFSSASKVFITTCCVCNHNNRLDPINMSVDLLKSCQEYL